MDIDPEQPVDRVGILLQRVAEQGDSGIDHQHVQRPAVAHPCDHRVAIGAVSLNRSAAGLFRQVLGGLPRAAIAEGDVRPLRRKAPDDGCPYAPAAAENQYRFSFKRGHHRPSLSYYVICAT